VKRRAQLRPEAQAEFVAQRRWYESKRVGLGDDFEHRVDEAISKALRAPQLYPVVHRNFRRVLVKRFPFAVFFVENDGGILVFAIFNCARSPKAWKSR
jgi:toxin ParE1/3/4